MAGRPNTSLLFLVSLLLLITFSDIAEIASQSVPIVARQLHKRSHACFSALSAAQSASVFLLALMATSKFALATITGRPRQEDPSALEILLYDSNSIIG
uniref:Uncharacterized protein n=1 Tax=Quercus lobata TaxID=97700 RepID=A0A7N2KY02_QUELO